MESFWNLFGLHSFDEVHHLSFVQEGAQSVDRTVETNAISTGQLRVRVIEFCVPVYACVACTHNRTEQFVYCQRCIRL